MLVLTTIEVSLQGLQDQLRGDAAAFRATQIVDHVYKVTQTKEFIEPEDRATQPKIHTLAITQ